MMYQKTTNTAPNGVKKFLGVVALLLVAGCGGASNVAAAHSTAADQDHRFLHLAYKFEPSLKGNDKGLVHVAHTVCDAFDEGSTFNETGEAMIGNGMSGAQAGTVMAAAVRVYCPQNVDVIP